MKVFTPEIHWHEKEAIFSVDVQKKLAKQPQRLATGGLDGKIRIWKYERCEIKFLSNLSRHDKAVNVVRFSKSGLLLASAGDDSIILLWKLSEKEEAPNIFDNDAGENLEVWCTVKTLRGHLEDINDLSWSHDDQMLVSGSVDHTAILWDVEKGQKLSIFSDAKHFVNGVTFDPLGQYLATMSCDRALRIYSLQTKKLIHCVSKMNQPFTSKDQANAESQTQKMQRIFHDETVVRRRTSFTVDGKLLITPSGCLQVEESKGTTQQINTAMIFSRNCLSKPIACLPNLKEPACIVACCPVLFTLRQESNGKSSFKLGYRNIFAVASSDTILIYDTQHIAPFSMISNIHYASITDLSWSSDASFLSVSSRDGFCSVIQFEDGELGEVYDPRDVAANKENTNSEAAAAADPPGIEEKIASVERDEPMKTDNANCVEGKLGESVANSECEPMDVSNHKTEPIDSATDPPQRQEIDGADTPQTKSSEPTPRRIALTTLQTEPKPCAAEFPLKSSQSPKPTVLKVTSEKSKQPRRIELTPIITDH